MDIVGEFDGTGVNVGLRIPLTSDYRLNLGFTHIEKLPEYGDRYWQGHPGFTVGLDMAVPRDPRRRIQAGPSNPTNLYSVQSEKKFECKINTITQRLNDCYGKCSS